MLIYWVKIILGRYCKLGWIAAILAVELLAAPPVPAPESLAKKYRESPNTANRAALERFAAAHPKDLQGALARFALGMVAYEQQNWSAAIENLKASQPRLARIGDYVSYYLVAARVEHLASDITDADLAPVLNMKTASPLVSKALVLRAHALEGANRPVEAVRLLRERYAELSQPEGALALASAARAAGNLAQAAGLYQQVYYNYPSGEAATQAGTALASLQQMMGADYPVPPPEQVLKRATRLMETREYAKAREAFQSAVSSLSGFDRERARVGLGAVDYLMGRSGASARYLKSLELPESEADAERLYYLAECARRMGDDEEMLSYAKQLEKRYPNSPWRLKALISAGNRFLLINKPERYEPLFKDLYGSFPGDIRGAYGHWKVAFNAYLSHKRGAEKTLWEHVEQFPSRPTAGSALYFLGRLAETESEHGDARAFYAKITELFPNYYYGLQARERLTQPKLVSARPSENVLARLSRISFPVRLDAPDLKPASVTVERIARARLLHNAGFMDWAEAELRFGAKTDGQQHLIAMEMARLAESPTEGLRMMKSLGADYLTLEFEDVPVKFWEYLFPMPYRKDVVATARLRALDPYILAGLIRQESEFDPKARSHKNAYGLTQVLPSTGRQIARNAGVSKFRTPMLYQPAVNLKLGSYYLRSMLDQWGGKWEHTLAAYNAGPHRVSEWLTWNSYSEPAEFIETIPFTETREYVQAVLRNAALYRRLYPEQKDERVENKKVLPKNSTPAVKTTRKATAGKAKRSASKKAA